MTNYLDIRFTLNVLHAQDTEVNMYMFDIKRPFNPENNFGENDDQSLKNYIDITGMYVCIYLNVFF